MRRAAAIVGVALLLVTAILAVRRALAVRDLDRLAPDAEGARTGSWRLPRGGPYLFGFDAPGPAELWLAGRLLVSGTGERSARVVLGPGIQAVRFVGPPGSRLLWHPPGRRGALEYVPPSSLSPEPPERARFGAGAGAWWLEACAASAILLVLAAAALLLLRPRRDPSEGRQTALVVGAVLLLAFAVRLAAGFGQTWDEDEYWSAGRNYLVNLLDLDFSAHAWRFNHEHPPVTKYLAGLGALWQDGYGVARALFSLMGAGTCALAVLIGRRLFSLRAGLYAGLAAALLPRLVAHDQIVGHETPSVFFWALAVWLAVSAADGRMARRLAWCGVAVGLAVGTRFSNLLLLPAVGLAVVATAPRERILRAVDLAVFVVPAVAAATFLAVWPRMWHAPGAHLSAAWEVLKRQHLPEQYLGHTVQIPAWHYFPVYFLATTPLLVLAGALGLGAWRAAARRERALIAVAALLIVPFGVAYSPVRQDGVRYILPVLLGAALLLGAGLDHLGRRVRLTAGALLLYLGASCAWVWPYYLDYFGEQVGGAGTALAHRWFEVGWWGEGISEAVAYVNGHAPANARLFRQLQPTHLNWFREDLWTDVPAAQAEWMIVNEMGIATAPLYRRPPFVPPPGARLVHDVRVQGASIARVYQKP